MDEQNTQNPDPVTQPAGEASSPTPQPEPASASVETPPTEPITETASQTPTAQMAGNEPLPESTPKTEETPRTPRSETARESTRPPLNANSQGRSGDEGLVESMPAQAQVITASPRNLARLFLQKAQAVIQLRKQKKLLKIMSLFEKKKHITNDEVEKLLHVSDATATRYLSHLEQQGKIKQTGKTGKGVTYTKN